MCWPYTRGCWQHGTKKQCNCTFNSIDCVRLLSPDSFEFPSSQDAFFGLLTKYIRTGDDNMHLGRNITNIIPFLLNKPNWNIATRLFHQVAKANTRRYSTAKSLDGNYWVKQRWDSAITCNNPGFFDNAWLHYLRRRDLNFMWSTSRPQGTGRTSFQVSQAFLAPTASAANMMRLLSHIHSLLCRGVVSRLCQAKFVGTCRNTQENTFGIHIFTLTYLCVLSDCQHDQDCQQSFLTKRSPECPGGLNPAQLTRIVW